jgi:hypothetical protein
MKRLLINIRIIIGRICVLLWVFLLLGCSSTRQIQSWKNPKFEIFKPKKILVIGVTPNHEARKAFEFQMITELNAREITALQSAVVFESSFKDSEQTEKDIEFEVNKLISKGYDTVLVSLVKAVEDYQSYGSSSSKSDYYLKRSLVYYITYNDDVDYQDYFSNYQVFNIEASIYNLNKDSEIVLVWRATFDLIDPGSTSKTISVYTKKLIKALEKEKII